MAVERVRDVRDGDDGEPERLDEPLQLLHVGGREVRAGEQVHLPGDGRAALGERRDDRLDRGGVPLLQRAAVVRRRRPDDRARPACSGRSARNWAIALRTSSPIVSVRPEVMTPTTPGRNFSTTRPSPALRFSQPPKMAASSLIAVELSAIDSLKWRESWSRMNVEQPCAPWRSASIRSTPRYASVAPSAGEFFCGFTVAAFAGTSTRDAREVLGEERRARGRARRARSASSSAQASSQGARADERRPDRVVHREVELPRERDHPLVARRTGARGRG